MYYVYILKCGGGQLYTGITTEPERRLSEHKSGAGAKYTRSHGAEAFAALWTAPDRSAASRIEFRIKHLTRAQKLSLIADNSLFAEYIGDIGECTRIVI